MLSLTFSNVQFDTWNMAFFLYDLNIWVPDNWVIMETS
ncbi:hypothetical protein M2273_000303 [Mucilaginibacter lappiensis]